MPCELLPDNTIAGVPQRCTTCPVRSAGLCRAFTEQELTAVHTLSRCRALAGGEVLELGGTAAGVCAMLVSGTLKVCRSDMPGSGRAVQLLFPGDLVGGLFAPDRRETFRAVTAAELCVWSRETLLTLVRTHAHARHLLLRQAFANLEDARRRALVPGR